MSPITDGLNGGDTIYFRVWHYATKEEALATAILTNGGSPIFENGLFESLSSLTATTVAVSDPLLSSPANGATGQPINVTLKWGSVTGATSYSVQVSASGVFGSTVASQSGLTGQSAAVVGLIPNTTYYWRANASNKSVTSIWAGIWIFTTLALPGAPTLTTPTNGSAESVAKTTSLTLSWGTVATASSYSLEVSTGSAFVNTFLNLTGITATDQAVTSWPASSVYFWRVSAANSAGTGSWSATWSIALTVPVLPREKVAVPGAPFSYRNGYLCYRVPATGKTEITVYDILGRIAFASTMVEAEGTHSVNLSSVLPAAGRYLARLRCGSFARQISFFYPINRQAGVRGLESRRDSIPGHECRQPEAHPHYSTAANPGGGLLVREYSPHSLSGPCSLFSRGIGMPFPTLRPHWY